MENMGFAITIGALKDIAEKCPDHNIDRLGELFDKEDIIEQLSRMTWFICVLNKWYCWQQTRSFDGALTEGDINAMDLNEIKQIFSMAMKAFKTGKNPSTKVEPIKKTKAAEE